MGFFKSYHYTPTTRSARPLLPFPPLALVMDAKTDAKSFTPYFILSKKLQKSRLSLRTSGFLVRPMRFERTAFGVGAGLSIDSPHIFRRKGAEFEQNQAFHANFLQVRAMRQGWCGRQDGR